jgi:hypothetical protein
MATVHIFLSYHTPDRPAAEGLAQALKKQDAQIEVFLAPWALRPGAYWIPELAQAIQKADAFLLLLGRAGPGRWQLLEYYEALDRKAREPAFPLVPLLIETAQPNIPFLNLVHWLQAGGDPTAPAVVEQLLPALQGQGLTPVAKPWLVHNHYKGLEALTEARGRLRCGTVAPGSISPSCQVRSRSMRWRARLRKEFDLRSEPIAWPSCTLRGVGRAEARGAALVWCLRSA